MIERSQASTSGELIRHDSSRHKFSPYAEDKWCLITSLDDHSRLLLYAPLVERELSWHHILTLTKSISHLGHSFPLLRGFSLHLSLRARKR
jgi:hypothetical protein